MNKVVGLIVVVLIIGFTIAVFFDHKSENEVYDFCKSHAIGNKISQVKISAEKQQFQLEQPDSSTLLLVKAALLPLSKSFICEIEYQQEKITQLSFIRQ